MIDVIHVVHISQRNLFHIYSILMTASMKCNIHYKMISFIRSFGKSLGDWEKSGFSDAVRKS